MTGYDGRGARFDITVTEGNDLSFTVTAVDSDSVAVDLSSATIVGTIYNSDGTAIDTLSSSVGGASSNVITLSLTDTEVDALVDPKSWALIVTRSGDDRTWLAGKFNVVAADRARNGTSGTAVTATVDTNVVVTATALGGGLGDALLAPNNLSDLDNAATARTNLGVEIGADVQAYSAGLSGLSAFGATLIDDDDAAAARTTLGAAPLSIVNGIKAVYGAVGDMVVLTDAVVTAGDATVTSASASFTAADIGKVIAIPYAGADSGGNKIGQTHMSTIASVNSSTSIEMADVAVRSVSAGRTITDGQMNTGSTTLNSATAAFTDADIGKKILLDDTVGPPRNSAIPGPLDGLWEAKIVSVTSATAVVLDRFNLEATSGTTIEVIIPGAWVGYGTDDTTAFQDAADAGGVVDIEVGRYLLTAEIDCGSFTTWIGRGPGLSIVNLVGSGALSAFRFDSAGANYIKDLSFIGFEIDGSGCRGNTYSSGRKALYIQGCERLIVERMFIHDTSATSIGCDYIPFSTIKDNVVRWGGSQVAELGGSAGGACIGIGTGATQFEPVTIMGNQVAYGGAKGIFVESQSSDISSEGTRIIGNYVEACGQVSSQQYGIGAAAVTGAVIANNVVVDCANAIRSSVGFVTSLASKGTLITGNVVSSRRNGIPVFVTVEAGGDCYIKDNIFRYDAYSTCGIDLNSETGAGTIIVDGNVWTSDGSANARCMDIDVNCTNLVITNNTTQNPGSGANTRPAIDINATATTVIVRDNFLFDDRGGSAAMSYGLDVTGGTIGSLIYDGNTVDGAVTGEANIPGSATITTITRENDVVPQIVTGTTDTLAAADLRRLTIYSNASAVTVTVPTGTFTAGDWFLLQSTGAGGLSLSTSGITLNGSSPSTGVAQNESLLVVFTAANTISVFGGTV